MTPDKFDETAASMFPCEVERFDGTGPCLGKLLGGKHSKGFGDCTARHREAVATALRRTAAEARAEAFNDAADIADRYALAGKGGLSGVEIRDRAKESR